MKRDDQEDLSESLIQVVKMFYVFECPSCGLFWSPQKIIMMTQRLEMSKLRGGFEGGGILLPWL